MEAKFKIFEREIYIYICDDPNKTTTKKYVARKSISVFPCAYYYKITFRCAKMHAIVRSWKRLLWFKIDRQTLKYRLMTYYDQIKWNYRRFFFSSIRCNFYYYYYYVECRKNNLKYSCHWLSSTSNTSTLFNFRAFFSLPFECVESETTSLIWFCHIWEKAQLISYVSVYLYIHFFPSDIHIFVNYLASMIPCYWNFLNIFHRLNVCFFSSQMQNTESSRHDFE